MHFQAYLLEGLMRWNKDRGSAVVGVRSNTYDSHLICAINTLGVDVLGKAVDTTFVVPNVYTGILLVS